MRNDNDSASKLFSALEIQLTYVFRGTTRQHPQVGTHHASIINNHVSASPAGVESALPRDLTICESMIYGAPSVFMARERRPVAVSAATDVSTQWTLWVLLKKTSQLKQLN
jgi:hypothetical protein